MRFCLFLAILEKGYRNNRFYYVRSEQDRKKDKEGFSFLITLFPVKTVNIVVVHAVNENVFFSSFMREAQWMRYCEGPWMEVVGRKRK